LDQASDSHDETQGTNEGSLPVRESVSSPASIVQQSAGAIPPDETRADSQTDGHEIMPVRVVNLPLTTQDVGDRELSEFERWSIRFARWSFFVATVTLAAIIVTAGVFWEQFKEMSSQTNILAISARQSRRDSAASSVNAAKQIKIAEQQAAAAQDSVKAIQEQATIARQLAKEDRRPWVGASDFECANCATIPKETNPNDFRTPVTVEEITWGDMSIVLENFGRTPAIDMNFSSFFGIVRTKSQPIPDYDSILAELTPKTIPDQLAKQVEIVKTFTGLISTVLPPNSSRKIKMPQQGAGGRRLNVTIPEQTVTYVLGRITYYGPERRKQFITNFCLMNEKGVEFRFCPSGNDMK